MNKKIYVSYTILSILVFLFSITFFSLNLYNNYKIGKNNAGSKYYEIGLRINDSAQTNTNSFFKNIENTIKDYTDVASITIYLDNKIAYSYPTAEEVNTTSKLVQNFTTKFETPIGLLSINANIYNLNPYTISYFAKLSFLMILIMTLITVMLIIYINISENKSKSIILNSETEDSSVLPNSENDDYNSQDDSVYMEEEEIFDDSDVIPEDTAFELLDEETAVPLSETLDNKNVDENNIVEDEVIYSSDDMPEDIIEKTSEIENEDSFELPYEQVKPLELLSTDNSFNPVSGLSLNTSLKDRLENEIGRSIASEFDLAVFMIKFNSIEKASLTYKNICNALVDLFHYKDFVFEYDEHTIVAIKININLEEALDFSDGIMSIIKQITNIESSCNIGISTRSLRMVTSDRLLLEAEEALKHSYEDPTSPVVAFRVDNEKYREYMELNKD